MDNRVTRVAWLNRSTILYAGNDKWCLDPRVELHANTKTEYTIQIKSVDVYDEGPYTCSVQTDNHPKTSRVHLIVQGKGFAGSVAPEPSPNGLGANAEFKRINAGLAQLAMSFLHISVLILHIPLGLQTDNLAKMIVDLETTRDRIPCNVSASLSGLDLGLNNSAPPLQVFALQLPALFQASQEYTTSALIFSSAPALFILGSSFIQLHVSTPMF